MIDIPLQYDSVIGRLLPTLSLFGNRDLYYEGKPLTKGVGRLPLKITSSFFRKFVCPGGCYVCCALLKHSNDYIVGESSWEDMPLEFQEKFERRILDFEVKDIPHRISLRSTLEIHQPKQTSPRETNVDFSNYCTFLGTIEGYGTGCKLHTTGSPLECRSAYNMRVSEFNDVEIRVTKQGLGRAWRYDPAPECEFLDDVPFEELDLQDNIYILKRYREWAHLIGYRPAANRLSALIVRQHRC